MADSNDHKVIGRELDLFTFSIYLLFLRLLEKDYLFGLQREQR